MKILCLHGAGTSAAIFKSQTAAFRSKLGPEYTFEFLDGPFPGTPAPGIPELYHQQNTNTNTNTKKLATYIWWPQPTVPEIRAAHQRLQAHLTANGPYDALCCFSQGCSLAFSFLLYHLRSSKTPSMSSQPLPFQAVVFICGGVPFPVLEDLGVRVSARAHAINSQTVTVLRQKAQHLAHLAAHLDEIRPGVGLWDYGDDKLLLHDPSSSSRGKMPDETDVFGIDFTRDVPQDLRIDIPTVHVYGAKDPRWPSSMQLAYFCKEENRVMYDHGGGHDIPRSSQVSETIAGFFRELSNSLK
ncbi:serine hydrolase FSH [Podospora didyma]|uniref:Serine hydrolase FSH n=1 Tax=Podospora didyma TaxID=330526 RepID=A0AAE0TVS6_9PEZI|nr:serine hydrolase FSH [Podospora didyma]